MTKWSASQRPSVPVEKSSFRSVSGRGPGRFPGLFLTEVVAHLDRERQHLNERSGRRVVDQFGRDLSPVRRNQNAFLSHGRSDQSEREDEAPRNQLYHQTVSCPSPCSVPLPYCSSVTCSIQSTGDPFSFSWMAMWLMPVLAVAPCQCFSPGSNQTTSPGRISWTGPPLR